MVSINKTKEYNTHQIEIIKEHIKNLSGINKDEIIFNAVSKVLKRDKQKYLDGKKKLSSVKMTQIEKKADELIQMKINRLYNRGLLQSVVQNTKRWAGVNLDEVVANATVLTFKNYQAYLDGSRKLTPDDLLKIHKKATALVDDARELIVAEANAFPISLATEKAVGRLRRSKPMEGETPDQFKQYLMQNFYYVMGLQVAYGKWDEGAIIKGPHAEMADYQVREVITHPHGLQIVVLFPTNIVDPSEKPTPIFCCRGSCTIHNLFDDLGSTVGSFSFDPAREMIKKSLLEIGHQYGPVVLTGHSLGGALCQLITANFCDIQVDKGHSIVKEVHMYNAPGVGTKTAHQYALKREALKPEYRPDVYHARHIHDVVSVGGGRHIQIDYHQDIGEWNLPMKPYKMVKEVIAAHSRIDVIRNYVSSRTVTAGKRLLEKTLNFTHKTAGTLLRLFVADLMYKQNMYNHASDQVRRFLHS